MNVQEIFVVEASVLVEVLVEDASEHSLWEVFHDWVPLVLECRGAVRDQETREEKDGTDQ